MKQLQPDIKNMNNKQLTAADYALVIKDAHKGSVGIIDSMLYDNEIVRIKVLGKKDLFVYVSMRNVIKICPITQPELFI